MAEVSHHGAPNSACKNTPPVRWATRKTSDNASMVAPRRHPALQVFERGFLETCLPTFTENLSGWGLDWVWPHRLGVETRRSAVIDAVAVTHTRPVGGPSRRNLRETGVNAQDEAVELLRRHGLERRPQKKVIAAMDDRGTTFDTSDAANAKVLDELLMRDWNAFLATRPRAAMPQVAVETRFMHPGAPKPSLR